MTIYAAKPRRLTIVLAVAVALTGLSVGSAVAEDKPRVPSQAKVIAETARNLSSYYSGAKTSFEIARSLAEALDLIEPNDADAKFKELHDELLTVAAGINWGDAKDFLDQQRGPATRAIRNLKRDGTAVRGSNEDQDSGNAAETLRLGGVAFHRPYDPRVTEGRWTLAIKYEKSELDVQPGDLVYDWRLGIPVLLEVISYRLQFIAAIDPNFRNDDLYDEELESYRQALELHYQKMIDGIKCADYVDHETCLWWIIGCHTPLPPYSFACADIRTGIEAVAEFWTSSPPADAPTMATLRSQVQRAMPLFEVKAMIDLLQFYQTPNLDLTALNEHIPVLLHGDLCLDVQSGNPDSATPLWLYSCSSTDAQRWVYDRKSATIRNPSFNKCLDVQFANPVLDTPVWTWDCNGGDAQRWTYSHQTHRLENALGTALQIRPQLPWWWLFFYPVGSSSSFIRAEAPVRTWLPFDVKSQQWLAEQAVCAHSVCEAGSPLLNRCDSCVTHICEIDSFCCNFSWDDLCVNEAKSDCKTAC